MNRRYSTKQFFELISKIRKINPNTLFTTDYIVGFPTETNHDHELSIEFLKKVLFFDMHIFPYSKRKDTKAALLKDVDEQIKKRRFKEISELNLINKRKALKEMINKELDVIFETKKEDEEYYSGYSSEYCRVFVDSNINLEKKMYKVRIVKVLYDGLFGEIIK